jgi:hypothetical protein
MRLFRYQTGIQRQPCRDKKKDSKHERHSVHHRSEKSRRACV